MPLSMTTQIEDATRHRVRLGRFAAAVVVLTLVVGASGVFAPTSGAASDSQGTDHWLVFQNNNCCGSPTLTLFISGPTATTGTVEIPGTGFSTPFSVTPGAVTEVVLPPGSNITTSDTVTDIGVHVTSAAEVTVYGLNRVQATTDAFLALPTDILGTDYLVLGYPNSNIINETQFAVVATQNATTVTITPSITVGARAGGVPFDVVLDQGEAFQLIGTESAPADLSGTSITSDKPIAVFGGHGCVNIPAGVTACDHIVEQLPPTSTWGRTFVTMPLATRIGGDTFRIIASQPGTTVSINGSAVATLGAGQVHEQLIDGPSTITANNPVLVAQYSNGSSFDGVTSDPFMMLVPPSEQFLAEYTVTTPASGFATNFINVVAQTSSIGSIRLDGVAIPSGDFTPIGSSGFSGAQLPVAVGSHTLDGALPFGVFVYGFDSFDSYGYPGGLNLAPVALVTAVTLTPETQTLLVDTEGCVDATVTDSGGAPLEGIRVDFVVAGENPTEGFVNSDANGVARFCWTGDNLGDDTVTAAVGGITDTATVAWVETLPVDPEETVTPAPAATPAPLVGVSQPATAVAQRVPAFTG